MISIVIPTYNASKFMPDLLDSIFRNKVDDMEVIIVDDGSPDKSGAIADKLAEKYPDIISVHHETNLGYGAALQTGFEYSLDYEWICFTDGDDQYDVNELYHLSKLFHHYDLIVTFRYSKIYGNVRS